MYTDDSPVTAVDSWAIPGGFDGFAQAVQPVGPHSAIYYHLTESPTFVVCEKFVNRNIPGADISPLLIEGVIRYLVPPAFLTLQPASGKNTAVSDDVLARLGLYFVGDHHRDRTEAARHLVWNLKTKRHLPTLRAGWPSA
jgi:hypothetical protein